MTTKKTQDRIETVEEAFAKTGRPEVDFSNFPEDLREYMQGVYNAVVITEALNEGKKPDWDDSSQYKWRPWFRMSPAGFRLGDTYCDYTYSYAGSGSHLC